MSGAPSSATSALDAFMDMSADSLAAAAARGGLGSFRHSSSSAGVVGAASASAGSFHRYGLEHPAANDGAKQQKEGQEGQQQQQGDKQVGDMGTWLVCMEWHLM